MAYVCLFYINVFVFSESEIGELETNGQLDEVCALLTAIVKTEGARMGRQIRPGSFYSMVYSPGGIIFTRSPALLLAERLPNEYIMQSFKKS